LLAKDRRGKTHLLGRVPGVVDHDVPAASAKRLDVVVPVTDQLLDLGEQVRVGASPVEERQRVPAGQGVPDQVRTDEPGASQDQDALGRRLLRCRIPGLQSREHRSARGSRVQGLHESHAAADCRRLQESTPIERWAVLHRRLLGKGGWSRRGRSFVLHAARGQGAVSAPPQWCALLSAMAAYTSARSLA
jgi:hypothetical protein